MHADRWLSWKDHTQGRHMVYSNMVSKCRSNSVEVNYDQTHHSIDRDLSLPLPPQQYTQTVALWTSTDPPLNL